MSNLEELTREYVLHIQGKDGSNNNLTKDLEKKLIKYNFKSFSCISEANEYIKKEIDKKDNKIALLLCENSLHNTNAFEYLKGFDKTHPKAKKLLLTNYVSNEEINSGLVENFNVLVDEKKTNDHDVNLIDLIGKVINDYEKKPNIEYSVGETKFKQVETLHEKLEFLKLRYQIYKDHYKEMSEEERLHKMEWDEYDLGGIESLELTPKIRYIIAKNNGTCVGGARVIDGYCPLEEGVCIEDGFGLKKGEKFTLDSYRKENILTREISRLIVKQTHRTNSSIVLLGLFKMIENITCENNYLFCTSRENQKKLFQAIGFEQIGPKIQYSLKGEWVPMKRDRFKAINYPESIEGMSKRFHQRGLEPIEKFDSTKWYKYSKEVNKEAIKRGFYNGRLG